MFPLASIPLALGFATIGATFGYAVGRRTSRSTASTTTTPSLGESPTSKDASKDPSSSRHSTVAHQGETTQNTLDTTVTSEESSSISGSHTLKRKNVDDNHYPTSDPRITKTVSFNPPKKRNTSPAPVKLEIIDPRIIDAEAFINQAIKRKLVEDDDYDTSEESDVEKPSPPKKRMITQYTPLEPFFAEPLLPRRVIDDNYDDDSVPIEKPNPVPSSYQQLVDALPDYESVQTLFDPPRNPVSARPGTPYPFKDRIPTPTSHRTSSPVNDLSQEIFGDSNPPSPTPFFMKPAVLHGYIAGPANKPAASAAATSSRSSSPVDPLTPPGLSSSVAPIFAAPKPRHPVQFPLRASLPQSEGPTSPRIPGSIRHSRKSFKTTPPLPSRPTRVFDERGIFASVPSTSRTPRLVSGARSSSPVSGLPWNNRGDARSASGTTPPSSNNTSTEAH